MKAAELLVRCLENEGVELIFGLPGEENIDVMDAYPERKVVAVTGDAGFMMNSQEIETAVRQKTPFVVLIWNDSEYGFITWHQLRHFGRTSHIAFGNPDFVKYAESFGAKGYRVEKTADLVPILKRALADDTVAIIDCPVDYRENMKLTERLQKLVSPV